jgi:citrate synthase
VSPAENPASKGGLEGIIAGTSALGDVNGKTGQLLYCGYDIVDLVQQATFEETAYLLWHEELPTLAQLQELRAQFGQHSEPHHSVWNIVEHAPADAEPMDILRTQISQLGIFDPQCKDNSENANRDKAARLVAQTGMLVATTERIRQGHAPVSAHADLGLAANFLYVLRGQKPTDAEVSAFDACLVLHAEHGLNASTFAARITAATLSDMHSAITSAIGTLKGPLHGGANEGVMDLLRELPDVEHVPQHIRKMLAAKRRIMGFGHRVYRTEDPRATVLREYSRKLGEQAGNTRWYDLTRAVEAVVLEEKGLYPNVDLYSASVYTYLGIPQRLFTPIFAVSRMAGWTAHVIEQHRNNRLIRPDVEYVGRAPRPFVPLQSR